MERRYPLHVHISTLFMVLILLVGGLIAYTSYRYTSDVLETTAEDLAQRVGRETLGEIKRLLAPAEMAIGTLSYHPLAAAGTLGARMAHLELMSTVLNESTALSSVYFAYPGGDFFFMRKLLDDADRQSLKAPPKSVYLVQSVERSERGDRGSWIFLGAELQVLRQDDRPDYVAAYDPRNRGWYKEAIGSAGLIRTAPYVFFSDRKVGMTLAARTNAGYGVVAADIRLETLSTSIARQKVTPGTQIALIDSANYVIAHEDTPLRATAVADANPDAQVRLTRIEDFGIPALARLAPSANGKSKEDAYHQRITVDDMHWWTRVVPIKVEAAQPLSLVLAIPEKELLATAIRIRNTSLLITALIIVFAVPAAWFAALAITRPMRELAGEAEAIRHFEFINPITTRSLIKEVDELAVTMGGMKRAIHRFLQLGATIAGEQDFDRLMPVLLTESLAAAGASAGVLYLDVNDRLVPAAACNSAGDDLVAGLDSQAPDGPLLAAALAAGVCRVGALQDADFAVFGGRDAPLFRDVSYGFAVPLINRQQQRVGAMLLLRATEIEDAQVAFIQALSGTAASVLETRELIKSQKALFEAFIQLIAGAIDAKSPYTGAHCARVPELTKMLAQAACAETRGLYADFNLNEEQWEAVHVASWLHDCGKVTTPEYIVDKATKLETIHDRIHEVRTRFEVLKRDAEITCLKAIAAGESGGVARQRFEEEIRALDDDYAFIAECNIGGEFMAPDRVERLKRVAQRTWIRTLDDRIGVSHEELARMDRTPAMPLPAVETLLADKPEHRFERSPQDRMSEDNRWGFRIRVPELLYNRGEIHNLSVARGTLSEEERYKINEHMVQTIKMLSGLPFPKHLREVPEIAGGHHEKMDGTGYPKRLKREDMSPVARMMAIADIFEALTAADRPYKKAKPLSEAIRIMSFMKKDRHIDPDLFDLFLRSGVWMDYAKRYLGPGQIDEVDVAQYLSAPAV